MRRLMVAVMVMMTGGEMIGPESCTYRHLVCTVREGGKHICMCAVS